MKKGDSRLTKEEVEQFRSEGYVLLQHPVFPGERFEELKSHFESLLEKWPAGERPEAMDTLHFGDPELNEWALAPEVVDLVEPLLGPDILLFSTHFICKPKGDGRRVPWHKDSAYRHRLLDPMEVATVWLAIDPSTLENGCMHVIPRSHRTGKKRFSDYEIVDLKTSVFESEIIKPQRKDELAVPCEPEPNHCSLHDARIQHGSHANRSTQRRCGWTLRFIPDTSRLNPDYADRQLLYLARGRNLRDQELADATKGYSHVIEQCCRMGFKAH